MTWVLRVTDVRRRQDSVRWTVAAARGDESLMVFADTTSGGRVIGIQTPALVGTTGDPELDGRIGEHIVAVLGERHCLRQLGEFDQPRRRSDRLRWPA